MKFFFHGYSPAVLIYLVIVTSPNQSTVSTAKRLASLIASTIDALHDTIMAMKLHAYGTRSTM